MRSTTRFARSDAARHRRRRWERPAAGVDRCSAQQDSRYFADTGFRIDNDQIWDYFSKRNGKRNFGLPTSRTFEFLGAPTQFFQRHVLQVTGSGVQTLNLLDEGLLPYTTIGGSTFPAVDPSVVERGAEGRERHLCGATWRRILDTFAPNTWEGEPVKFSETFSEHGDAGGRVPGRWRQRRPADAAQPGDLGPADLEAGARSGEQQLRLPAVPARRHALRREAASAPRGCCWPTRSRRSSPARTCRPIWRPQAADSPLFGQYDTGHPQRPAATPGCRAASTWRTRSARRSRRQRPGRAIHRIGIACAVERRVGQARGQAVRVGQPRPRPPRTKRPPRGDPKKFLARESEAGKGANEESKEAKNGSDNQKVWASNRIERGRTWANYNSGPVTIASARRSSPMMLRRRRRSSRKRSS